MVGVSVLLLLIRSRIVVWGQPLTAGSPYGDGFGARRLLDACVCAASCLEIGSGRGSGGAERPLKMAGVGSAPPQA